MRRYVLCFKHSVSTIKAKQLTGKSQLCNIKEDWMEHRLHGLSRSTEDIMSFLQASCKNLMRLTQLGPLAPYKWKKFTHTYYWYSQFITLESSFTCWHTFGRVRHDIPVVIRTASHQCHITWGLLVLHGFYLIKSPGLPNKSVLLYWVIKRLAYYYKT